MRGEVKRGGMRRETQAMSEVSYLRRCSVRELKKQYKNYALSCLVIPPRWDILYWRVVRMVIADYSHASIVSQLICPLVCLKITHLHGEHDFRQ